MGKDLEFLFELLKKFPRSIKESFRQNNYHLDVDFYLKFHLNVFQDLQGVWFKKLLRETLTPASWSKVIPPVIVNIKKRWTQTDLAVASEAAPVLVLVVDVNMTGLRDGGFAKDAPEIEDVLVLIVVPGGFPQGYVVAPVNFSPLPDLLGQFDVDKPMHDSITLVLKIKMNKCKYVKLHKYEKEKKNSYYELVCQRTKNSLVNLSLSSEIQGRFSTKWDVRVGEVLGGSWGCLQLTSVWPNRLHRGQLGVQGRYRGAGVGVLRSWRRRCWGRCPTAEGRWVRQVRSSSIKLAINPRALEKRRRLSLATSVYLSGHCRHEWYTLSQIKQARLMDSIFELVDVTMFSRRDSEEHCEVTSSLTEVLYTLGVQRQRNACGVIFSRRGSLLVTLKLICPLNLGILFFRNFDMRLWTWIMMTSILPSQGGGESGRHVIQKFVHQPGMHFEALGRLYLSSHVWTVATTTDVSPLFDRVEQMKKFHAVTLKACETVPANISGNFGMLLGQRIDAMLNLMDVVRNDMGMSSGSRGRRGIFNGLGTLVKSLIGTMDAEDAQAINERISKLEGVQGTSLSAVRGQLDIVNVTIAELARAENVTQMNENLLLEATRKLEERIKTYRESFVMRDFLEEQVMVLNAMIDGIFEDAGNIRRLLTGDNTGITQTGILSSDRLVEVLRGASLPKGLSFPVEIAPGNMRQLEQLSTVGIHCFGPRIVVVLEIPLVKYELFEVYGVHGVPVRTSEKVHSYLVPSRDLLVVNPATQQYIPMSYSDLRSCKRVSGQYLRTGIMPIHNKKPYSPCEVHMYSRPSPLPSTCVARHVAIEHFMLIHMRTDNAWIFVSPKVEEVIVKCDDRETRELLVNTGIIQVGEHCEIITTDFSIRGRKSSGLRMDLHLHPRMNLTINENVGKHLEEHYASIVPDHLVSVVRDVEQLKGLQVQLGDERKKLDDMPGFDFRTFLSHPSTVSTIVLSSLIIAIAIGLYCWCRQPAVATMRAP